MVAQVRYLNHLFVGQKFTTPIYEVTAEEIKAFAQRYDPQPFHLDEELAHDTFFQGLVASGWHTTAISMRLFVQSNLKPEGGIIGAGVDQLSWKHPVCPGDRLHLDIEVIEIKPSQSKPDQGLAMLRITAINQKQQQVMSYIAKLLMKIKETS